MAKYHEIPELPVIGTSRKPNSTDLHNRGLNGLPEPSPTIKLRKATLKKEQLALRMQLDSNIPVSYLRTRIGESSDESDLSSLSSSSDTDSNITGDETTGIAESSDESELSSLSSCSDTDSNTTSDETTVSESTVARDEEVVGVEKGGWNMRSRTAVQMYPYKREREVYKEMVKGRMSRKVEGLCAA